MSLAGSGHFGQQGTGGHGILITHHIAGHVAIALFATSDKLLHALQLPDQGSDEFKTGQGVITGYAVVGTNFFYQVGGNNGLNHKLIRTKQAQALAGAQDIVGHHGYHLVAIHQLVVALWCADGNAHPVGIGVGGHEQVGLLLAGLLQAEGKRFGLFRIGVHHGGEVSVGLGLLGYHMHLLKTHLPQGIRHHGNAGTMYRRINQLHLSGCLQGILVERQVYNSLPVLFIHLRADGLNQVAVEVGHLYLAEAADTAHLMHHVLVVRGYKLGAIAPISLIAIVFFGVVRGGNHHPALALERAYGKRQLGGRA